MVPGILPAFCLDSQANNSLHYAQDLGGTWYECILGVSAKLSDHSNGYLNVEKLFGGDYSSNVQLNAGCRWKF